MISYLIYQTEKCVSSYYDYQWIIVQQKCQILQANWRHQRGLGKFVNGHCSHFIDETIEKIMSKLIEN